MFSALVWATLLMCPFNRTDSHDSTFRLTGSAIESPPQLLFRGLPGSSFDTATSGGVDPRTGWPYVEADLGRDAVIPCFTSGTPPPITR